MAGSLSNWGEELALNLLFRATGTSPTTVYLGLATSVLDDSSTLASITEENDANYSRKAISFDAPSQVGQNATISSSADITFTAWAQNADLPITYCFISDVASGTNGHILIWFQMPTSKQPAAGETLTVPAGNTVISLG